MSGGYVYADFIRFGDDGGGELNLSGGTIDLSGYLQFTGGAGNAVTLNMTGGLINIDGWFQAPSEANGADAVTINLDGGTIRCKWFTHADVAYALDIKDGILIIDGDVRDDIIADVN
jgi:formylmethanofuran dehydrogenase subunit C